jgi:RNA polymerase sigma factor FliA
MRAVLIDQTEEGASPMTTTNSRKDLIQELMPTVHRIARRSRPRNGEYELDDLVQIGSLGLMEAVSKHGSEDSIGGFAVHRIRGAILDFLRAQDPLTRQQRKEVKQVNASRDRLGQKLARTPRASEVAADAGISFEEYARIALQAATSHCLADEDFLQSDSTTPSAALEQSEERANLIKAIDCLDGRLRELVEAHYVEGESLADIGRRFRLSPARMSQLHAAAVEQLRRQMSKSVARRARKACSYVSGEFAAA